MHSILDNVVVDDFLVFGIEPEMKKAPGDQSSSRILPCNQEHIKLLDHLLQIIVLFLKVNLKKPSDWLSILESILLLLKKLSTDSFKLH